MVFFPRSLFISYWYKKEEGRKKIFKRLSINWNQPSFNLFLSSLQDFSVSPSPLGPNWGLDLIGTWLGLGLGGFGTKGLGTGLDNTWSTILLSPPSPAVSWSSSGASTTAAPYASADLRPSLECHPDSNSQSQPIQDGTHSRPYSSTTERQVVLLPSQAQNN